MKNTLLTAFAILVTQGAIAAEPAQALQPATDPVASAGALPPRLQAADSNRDGFLDKPELAGFPRISKHFSRLDRDGDGRLSVAEIEAMKEKVAARKP